MAAKVFISYRREDAKYQARMIYSAFCRAIPSDHVFMDVDSIPPGADFRKVLEDWVGQCEVLLALIGPGWIGAGDPKTKERRLDNKSDFVRIEIGKALARGIPVVPVLLDDAPMPSGDVLPDDLKALVDRQAEFVQFRTFDADVEQLIKKLRLSQAVVRSGSPQQPVPTPALASSDDRYRSEGRIKVEAAIIHGAPDGWFLPCNGNVEWFRDFETGPEIVIAPAGKFMMGSLETKPDRWDFETPRHPVAIAQPFGVGRYAVTRGQFTTFVKSTGYRTGEEALWLNPGFPQDDDHPVVCVSWGDAKAFAEWLSSQSDREYRLLAEAEWEYAARAGTTTSFWWGKTITTAEANYNGNYPYGESVSKGKFREQTVAVSEFAPSPWGLYQVHGNVREWCEDTWHPNYEGAPSDGSAWRQGGDADRRVVRGGSWVDNPMYLDAANRYWAALTERKNNLGFRVACTLTHPV